MIKRFLYLQTRTYMSKDYNKYLDSLEEDTDLDESEAWKRDLKEEKDPPQAIPARVAIDPSKIVAYIETYSLEELHNNPENPKFDSIDLIMEHGLQLTVMGTLESLEKSIKELYN